MNEAHASLMDPVSYLYYVLVLGVVLGLIGLCALLMRRFAPGLGPRYAHGSQRRLAIIETLPLDARHRLVLLRRDQKEHLVVLGTDYSLIVENGIVPPALGIPPATQGNAV